MLVRSVQPLSYVGFIKYRKGNPVLGKLIVVIYQSTFRFNFNQKSLFSSLSHINGFKGQQILGITFLLLTSP